MVDRAKALADYALLQGNAFWQYLMEQAGEKMRGEIAVLTTTDDLPSIYRAQGRAAVWEMITRFPKELIERLKAGSGEGRPLA